MRQPPTFCNPARGSDRLRLSMEDPSPLDPEVVGVSKPQNQVALKALNQSGASGHKKTLGPNAECAQSQFWGFGDLTSFLCFRQGFFQFCVLLELVNAPNPSGFANIFWKPPILCCHPRGHSKVNEKRSHPTVGCAFFVGDLFWLVERETKGNTIFGGSCGCVFKVVLPQWFSFWFPNQPPTTKGSDSKKIHEPPSFGVFWEFTVFPF